MAAALVAGGGRGVAAEEGASAGIARNAKEDAVEISGPETLDWSRATIKDGGVDAVERHLLRFTDGGPL